MILLFFLLLLVSAMRPEGRNEGESGEETNEEAEEAEEKAEEDTGCELRIVTVCSSAI